MAFDILLTSSAHKHLKALRVFERRKIVDEMNQRLKHQPTEETKNCKCLEFAAPAFEHDPPLWELRVGEVRVFYDVQQDQQTVTVRAVRHKPPDHTTEDILHETNDH